MYRNATSSTSRHVLVNNNYYPYGLLIADSPQSNNRLKFQGTEKITELHLNTYDFHARMYDPVKVITWQLDPLASEFYSTSPYSFLGGNPLKFIDPTGTSTENWRKKHGIKQKDLNDIYKAPDWVEKKDGTIYWDNNATSQATTKAGETYLGKNVLVGTHNRDASGNETINTAKFDLYLESDKTGSSATIMGNTVPADVNKFGTLAEGVYSAEYAIYKGDGALLIGGGENLPTVKGNPNNPKNYNADGTLKPVSNHVMDNILFHKGNYRRKSLWTLYNKQGVRFPISEGCQTGGCGSGSLSIYRNFIKHTKRFKGSYYLRSRTK